MLQQIVNKDFTIPKFLFYPIIQCFLMLSNGYCRVMVCGIHNRYRVSRNKNILKQQSFHMTLILHFCKKRRSNLTNITGTPLWKFKQISFFFFLTAFFCGLRYKLFYTPCIQCRALFNYMDHKTNLNSASVEIEDKPG